MFPIMYSGLLKFALSHYCPEVIKMHHMKSANMDVSGSELISESFQTGGSLKEIVGNIWMKVV